MYIDPGRENVCTLYEGDEYIPRAAAPALKKSKSEEKESLLTIDTRQRQPSTVYMDTLTCTSETGHYEVFIESRQLPSPCERSASNFRTHFRSCKSLKLFGSFNFSLSSPSSGGIPNHSVPNKTIVNTANSKDNLTPAIKSGRRWNGIGGGRRD